jgi:hypothetical protein
MSNAKPRVYSVEQEEAAAMVALELVSDGTINAPPKLVRSLQETAAVIAESVPPVAPPRSLKERLMSRVANYEVLKPIADVRPHDGVWVSAGTPGVDVKPLFVDKATGRTTMLVRMQPGARLPAHRHHDDEQCMVLRGDVRWRDIVYEEGDFVVMGNESEHPEVTSVNGNLLLIIAGRNEYISA